jgi:hypothetical protein
MNPDFVIQHIGRETFIAHKLPGELRTIARIERASLDKRQQRRYARKIVDALNKEGK